MAARWEARCLFRLFDHERAFDPAVPSTLIRLGRLALPGAISGSVVRTQVILTMTIAAPAGQRMLCIAIDSQAIVSAIVGCLFLAFAHVMNEAIRIEDESRGFV